MLHPKQFNTFWLNPDGAWLESILIVWLHLHCNDRDNVVINRTTTRQSSNVGAFGIRGLRCRRFLDQSCHCWCVVLHVHWVRFLFETSPGEFALWIPVEMYSGTPTSTISGGFFQFQTRWSWNSKSLNSSHCQYLVNLFCYKWILIVIWKHQIHLLKKRLLLQK